LCVQNQVAFSLGTSGGGGTRGVPPPPPPPPPGRADARAERQRVRRGRRGRRMVVFGFGGWVFEWEVGVGREDGWEVYFCEEKL
jgi:hypothetical protein